MASMKDIKSRIKSVESTRQITKAMELVASSKLRKARERADLSRPFFTELYGALRTIAASNTDFTSDYLVQRPVKKSGYVLIAGDRGLAGGYNSNILKLVQQTHGDEYMPKIIAVGKKSAEFFTKHEYDVVAQFPGIAEHIKTADAADIAQIATDLFTKGEVDEIELFFTQFVSPLVQTPTRMPVLPIDAPTGKAVPENKAGTTYDPSPEAVFNRVIPKLITSLIMCAVNESYASELGARRTAMENATDNAEEMIANLSLMYNRARQEKITNELNENVSGANALN